MRAFVFQLGRMCTQYRPTTKCWKSDKLKGIENMKLFQKLILQTKIVEKIRHPLSS